jgi:hypothetical protein
VSFARGPEVFERGAAVLFEHLLQGSVFQHPAHRGLDQV